VLQGETRPEPSPRERLERLRVLAKRTRVYWKGALVVAVIVAAGGTLVAWRLPRIYMSETLLLVRDAIRTGPEEDGQGLRAARIAPSFRLKSGSGTEPSRRKAALPSSKRRMPPPRPFRR